MHITPATSLYGKNKAGATSASITDQPFSLALEESLLAEGVDILYDTLFVGSEIEDGVCKAVITENKSGRSRYRCKAVIDASGDAEVFARANEPCMAAKNSLAIWSYCTQGADAQYQKRGGPDGPGLSLVSFGKIDTQAFKHTVTVPYYGDTAEGINRFIIDGHARLLNHMKAHDDFVPASLPDGPDTHGAQNRRKV